MIRKLMSTLLTACLLAAISLTAAAEDPLWIDVRTAQEFSDGHVTEAVNIPYEEIGERIESVAPDKDTTIYLYCHSGRRAGIAKETLDDLGYTQVTNVGGLDEALQKTGQEAGE